MNDRLTLLGLGLKHHGRGQSELLEAFVSGRPLRDIAPVPLPEFSEGLVGLNLRRVPSACRSALQVALLALKNAGIKAPLEKNVAEKTGVYIASAHGAVDNSLAFLDSILDYGPALASPTAFSFSVNNAFAGLLSIYLNIQGPSNTSTQFGQSFAGALQAAGSALVAGSIDYALLGVVEEAAPQLQDIYAAAVPEANSLWDYAKPPQGESAIFFLLASSGRKPGVAISLPVWRAGDAARFEPDLLFHSGAPQAAKPGENILNCRELYGSTPAAQALDAALAAVMLQLGKRPSAVWLQAGNIPITGSGAFCCHMDPVTACFSAISIEEII